MKTLHEIRADLEALDIPYKALFLALMRLAEAVENFLAFSGGSDGDSMESVLADGETRYKALVAARAAVEDARKGEAKRC